MLEEVSGASYLFAAEMGQPTGIVERRLDVLGETVTATVLAVGNPQCVVLGPLPDDARFAQAGTGARTSPGLSRIAPMSSSPWSSRLDRVRIRIWERGVGPTESSGTGSCAAAVAAASHGGASRDVEVVAPGGTQRVAWTEAGITLTGWAEILADGTFCAQL